MADNPSTSTKGKQFEQGRKAFTSLDDARKLTPPSDRFKIFVVTSPEGKKFYTWSDGYVGALNNVCREYGWTTTTTDKPVTKDSLAAGLASLTPEDRAALIAQFVPAANAPASPTPPAGKGKGKPKE